MLSGSDYLMLYVALWIPAVAGCSFAIYILLRRRMHAAERGERWASLTRWTDGAGADNWRLAANRGGVIILAVTLTMLGTAYLQRYMPVLIDRTLRRCGGPLHVRQYIRVPRVDGLDECKGYRIWTNG